MNSLQHSTSSASFQLTKTFGQHHFAIYNLNSIPFFSVKYQFFLFTVLSYDLLGFNFKSTSSKNLGAGMKVVVTNQAVRPKKMLQRLISYDLSIVAKILCKSLPSL